MRSTAFAPADRRLHARSRVHDLTIPAGRVPAPRSRRAPSDERRNDAGGDETVEPIHQPAMSGNEMAGILAPNRLEKGSRTVAGLRGHRQHDREHGDREQSGEGLPSWRGPAPASTAASVPPIAPDQVLFDHPRQSLGMPAARPMK